MRDAQLGVLDTDDGNAHALLLGHLDTDGEVAVTRHQGGIGNGTVAGQFDQVGDDQGINPPLLARCVDDARTEMHIRKLGNGSLLRRQPAGHHAVVPINPQQFAGGEAQRGTRLFQQQIDQGCRIHDLQVMSLGGGALADDFCRLMQQITSVHHDYKTIHVERFH